MRRSPRQALLAAIVACGCSADLPDAPHVTALEPARGYSAVATEVVIHGSGFYVRPEQRVDRAAAQVDAEYRAWLGETPLLDVRRVDATTLRAIVPAALPPGTHALAVDGPFGRAGLDAAFLVVSGGPAALRVELSAPKRASVGQRFALSATVTNDGAAMVRTLSAAPDASGTGGIAITAADAAPADLAPGGTRTFTWSADASAPGSVTVALALGGTDEVTGEPVAAPSPSAAIEVERPPELSGTALVDATLVSVGQTIGLALDVVNAGDAAAAATPRLDRSGTAQAALEAAPAADVVPGHASRRFAWQLRATAAGTLALRAGVDALDVNASTPFSADATAPSITVQTPPSLQATASASRAQLSAGQLLEVALEVTNAGEATAAVTPACAVSGTALLAAVAQPADATLGAGEQRTFRWTFATLGAGTAVLAVRADGVDLNSGQPVPAAVPDPLTTVVQRPAALAATLVAPSTLSTGQPFVVDLVVRNGGDAAASVTPSLTITNGATLVTGGATPPPATIPGNDGSTFRWTFTAAARGTFAFTVEAEGVDENGAGPVSASSSASIPIQAPAALEAVATVAPERTAEGHEVVLTATVKNAGEATARAVRAAVPVTPPGVVLEGDVPAAVDVVGGDAATFTWRYLTTVAGSGSFAVDASGVDANTSRLVVAPRATTSTLVVDVAAVLSAAASAAPAVVSTAQDVAVTLTVTNSGGSAADVTPSIRHSGTAVLTQLTAPVPARVEPGRSAAFTWTWRAVSAGTATFTATADATDVAGGASQSLSAEAGPITVQSAAALTATATAVPEVVSVGQRLTVTVTATNAGGAAATVTPSVDAGPLLRVEAAPARRTIAGGTTESFSWTLTAVAAGDAAVAVALDGTDANSGAPVSAAATVAVHVDRPAALTASASATPAVVNVDGTLTATLTVVDVGEASAVAVVPSALETSGMGDADVLSGPTPAEADLRAGSAATFTWTLRATRAGAVAFTASASGVDGNSGAPVASTAATSPAVTVQRPARLSVQPGSVPARVNLGQAFTARFDVSNDGDSGANEVATAIAIDPAAAATSGPAPAPVVVAAGASVAVERSFSAASLGAATITASATGTDALDGRTVTASTVSSPLVVERPAALAAFLALPTIAVGTPFTVTMQVTNTGDAALLDVRPGALAADPSSTVAVTTSAATPSVVSRLAGGATATFTWTCTATTPGVLQLAASASGTDANDRATRTAAATSDAVPVGEVAQVFADDPFGDGTAFAYVFAHAGMLYLGPSRNGLGAIRSNPDGSSPLSVAFGFTPDLVDTDDEKLDSAKRVTSNPALPYRTLGRLGCRPDLCTATSCECGPDLEDGRGLFAAGDVGVRSWLVAAGARTDGGLHYAYLTADDGTALQFSFYDFYKLLSGETSVLTAMTVFDGQVFLSFSNGEGTGPYLVALRTMPATPSTPSQPGVDAVKDVDWVKLGLGSTVLGKPAQKYSWLDSTAPLGGRLYLANATGLTSYLGPPGMETFVDCTPDATAWASRTSLLPDPTRRSDVTPADKAIPQLTAWYGRLYAIRNTGTAGAPTGPQLWACDPGAGGERTICESGEWSLVAPNTTGDRGATQMNDAANVRATFLAASGKYLYVGFDDDRGVQLYRTANATPAALRDFRGSAGCFAGDAGCQGLGGNGLGVRTGAVPTRILDGKVFTVDGVDYVYVVAGDGSTAARVFRIAE